MLRAIFHNRPPPTIYLADRHIVAGNIIFVPPDGNQIWRDILNNRNAPANQFARPTAPLPLWAQYCHATDGSTALRDILHNHVWERAAIPLPQLCRGH